MANQHPRAPESRRYHRPAVIRAIAVEVRRICYERAERGERPATTGHLSEWFGFSRDVVRLAQKQIER